MVIFSKFDQKNFTNRSQNNLKNRILLIVLSGYKENIFSPKSQNFPFSQADFQNTACSVKIHFLFHYSHREMKAENIRNHITLELKNFIVQEKRSPSF